MPEFGAGLFGLGLGFVSIVQVFLFVALILIIWRGRAKYVVGTPIVIESFRIDGNPDPEISVEIIGRASGILSWVLTLLRIQTKIYFVVTATGISIRHMSLSGLRDTYIPLGKITATVCGYQRSILAFAFAAYFSAQFLMSLLTGPFLGAGQQSARASTELLAASGVLGFGYLALAAIAALIYFLSKRIGITVETFHSHGVAFKRSVIGNVAIELPDAIRVVGIINSLVLAAQTVRQGGAGAVASSRS